MKLAIILLAFCFAGLSIVGIIHSIQIMEINKKLNEWYHSMRK